MIRSLGLALLMVLFQSPAAAQAPPTAQQPELSKAAEPALPVDKGKSLLKIRRI
jgi:hypothetical protein